MGGRHRKDEIELPPWVEALTNQCLHEVARDVYYARYLAMDTYRAHEIPNCEARLREAHKALYAMSNPKLPDKDRCFEGTQADRKFWEAKVCARQTRARKTTKAP